MFSMDLPKSDVDRNRQLSASHLLLSFLLNRPPEIGIALSLEAANVLLWHRESSCLLERPLHLSGNEVCEGPYIAFDAGMIKCAQVFGAIIDTNDCPWIPARR